MTAGRWSSLRASLRARAGDVVRPPGRLSPLDAVFLPMETDVQPLHVGSVLVFEGPAPSPDEIRARIIERAAPASVARRRLVRTPGDLGRPRWADHAEFDVDAHLGAVVVEPPGDNDALADLVVGLMGPRLDLTRPPWQMWSVTGLREDRWAVVVKAHHALVDGVYGSDLALTVLSDVGRPVVDEELLEPSFAQFAAEGVAWLVLLVPRAVVGLARSAARPRRTAARVRLVRHGLAQLMRPDLPPSVLSGPLGRGRRWGWAGADLATVEAVARQADATVNDVFLAVLAGGYRRYLLARGDDPAATTLRVIVPVSQRSPDAPMRPGNLASAMFVVLPAGLDDARDRLGEVAARTAAQKVDRVGASTAAVVALADHVPWPVLAAAFRGYARHGQRRVNVVASNVAGPRQVPTLLGRRLLDLVPYVPLGEEIRASAGLVSCGGRVSLAVTADADALPDADLLVRAIAQEWGAVTAPSHR